MLEDASISLVSGLSTYLSSRCLTGAAVESVPTVGVPPNVGLNVITSIAMNVGAGEGSRVAMINSVGGTVGSKVVGVSDGAGLGSRVVGEAVGSRVVGVSDGAGLGSRVVGESVGSRVVGVSDGAGLGSGVMGEGVGSIVVGVSDGAGLGSGVMGEGEG